MYNHLLVTSGYVLIMTPRLSLFCTNYVHALGRGQTDKSWKVRRVKDSEALRP